MRFDPIPMSAKGLARLAPIGRRGAGALASACTALATTALLLTLVASLAVSRGGLAWAVLPLSLILFLPIAGFVVGRIGDHPHERFGSANVVTLLRGGMAAMIGASAWEAGPAGGADIHLQWALVGAALLALSLDGVDGFLARRSGLASRFGERFDMEVDAFLILILCVLAFTGGKAGPYVFAIGLMRYAFLAGGAVAPRLRRPLPPSLRRKTVCVLQIAFLCAALLPPVAPSVCDAMAMLALGLLTWSFAVDIRILLRERA